MKDSKVRIKLIEWFRYYFFFSKAALFISGMVFSHSLVEHRVVDLLMDYITDTWEEAHLTIAVAAVNMQQVITAIAVHFISYISDTRFGHYKMILFTTKAYILGLLLLWITGEEIWLLVVALLLLSVGKGGKKPPLEEFLADQLKGGHEQSLDVDDIGARAEARATVWWRFWWFLGFITATFAFPNVDWPKTFVISAALMFFVYWLLRFGECLPYTTEEQIAEREASYNPLSSAYHVLKAAIAKRGLRYPDAHEDTHTHFFKNDGGELILSPNIPFFRWLDKAAIVDPSSSPSPEDQATQRKLCCVAQVKQTKCLLKMVPMWTTFLVYGVVEATGSTFFVEQTSGWNSASDGSFFNVVIAFNAMTSFTSFIVPYLYEYLVLVQLRRGWGWGWGWGCGCGWAWAWGGPSKETKKQGQGGGGLILMLVRIGAGMVSSILCLSAAWVVEARRKQAEGKIGMSIWLLVPQFLLLGLMKGLAEGGLVDFFGDQVDDSMKCYGEAFTHGVLSIGQFVNVLFVLALRGWFSDSVNRSHLDRYYLLLTILSSGNLCFYCYVSYKYYYMGTSSTGRSQPEEYAAAASASASTSASVVDDFHHMKSQAIGLEEGDHKMMISSTRQSPRSRSSVHECSVQMTRRHSFKSSKSLDK